MSTRPAGIPAAGRTESENWGWNIDRAARQGHRREGSGRFAASAVSEDATGFPERGGMFELMQLLAATNWSCARSRCFDVHSNRILIAGGADRRGSELRKK